MEITQQQNQQRKIIQVRITYYFELFQIILFIYSFLFA